MWNFTCCGGNVTTCAGKLIVGAFLIVGISMPESGCTTSAHRLTGVHVVDRQSLARLVGGRDSVAIIVADPGDCLSCNYPLYTLLQARRHRRGVVLLVLSRAPSEFERRQLALQHEQADVVLQSTSSGLQFKEPTIFTVVHQAVSPPLTIVQAKPFIRALLREAGDSASVHDVTPES
jgi:hypothetical protein